jgi:phenylalanine-4-hydroxylase
MYDMAVGSSIVSCFSGPADPAAFRLNYKAPVEKTHKLEHTENAKQLFALYQRVREARENKEPLENLIEIWAALKKYYPDDWLCSLEILELLNQSKGEPLYREIKLFLDNLKSENDNLKKLIEDGYMMLGE